MPDIPLPLERLSDWRILPALLGRPLSHPEQHPPLPADVLRERLTIICEWAAEQPETGSPEPVWGRAWGYHWPLVPRTHRMYTWVQGMHNLTRWALRQLDQGRIHYATLLYHDLTLLSEHLSARLAEPLAQRGTQAIEASRTGGQNNGRPAYKEDARTRGIQLKQEKPSRTNSAMARLIIQAWKNERVRDEKPNLPKERTVRGWIANISPH